MGNASAQRRGEGITAINITPLVDVVLVLLIVLMVTATYVVSRTIPMDLPKSATGESTVTTLAISVDRGGALFLDAKPVTEDALRAAVRSAGPRGQPHALVAADGDTTHRRVVKVMDLLRQEGVVHLALNVQPEDTAGRR